MSNHKLTSDFSRHPLHYFTLLCLMLVGVWGIFWFSYQPLFQVWILVAMAVSYVMWGVLHHLQHQNLHPKIIMEYILVALLAFLVIGSLFFQA